MSKEHKHQEHQDRDESSPRGNQKQSERDVPSVVASVVPLNRSRQLNRLGLSVPSQQPVEQAPKPLTSNLPPPPDRNKIQGEEDGETNRETEKPWERDEEKDADADADAAEADSAKTQQTPFGYANTHSEDALARLDPLHARRRHSRVRSNPGAESYKNFSGLRTFPANKLAHELWEHRGLVALGAIMGLLIAIIAWLVPPDRFEAKAKLLIELPTAAPDPETARVLLSSATRNEQLLIQSRQLAEEIISTMELYTDPDFRTMIGLPGLHTKDLASADQTDREPPEALFNRIRIEALQRFSNRLGVVISPDSGLITVRFQASNPHLSARIVNGLIGQYLYKRQEFGPARRGDQRQQIEGNASLSDRSYSKLVLRLSKLALRRGQLETILNTLLISISDLSYLADKKIPDPEIKALWEQHQILLAEKKTEGPPDPRLAPVEERLRERIENATARIATEIDDMAREERDLRARASQARKAGLPGAADAGTSLVRVLSLADAPPEPVGPDLFSLFAGTTGAGAGFGLVFVLFFVLRGHIRRNRLLAIEMVTGTSPVIVAETRNRWLHWLHVQASKERERTRTLALAGLADEIVTMRMKKNQTRQNNEPILVMFSASRSGSCFGLGLETGRALALAGNRVVFVEANSSQPSLARELDLPARPGFIDILLGNASAQACTHSDWSTSLSVIPSGETSQAAAVSMYGTGLRLAFEAICTNYDYILVEAPPVEEAFRFTPLADWCYFVQPARQMSVEAAIAVMDHAGICPPIMGRFIIIGKIPTPAFRRGGNAPVQDAQDIVS